MWAPGYCVCAKGEITTTIIMVNLGRLDCHARLHLAGVLLEANSDIEIEEGAIILL